MVYKYIVKKLNRKYVLNNVTDRKIYIREYIPISFLAFQQTTYLKAISSVGFYCRYICS